MEALASTLHLMPEVIWTALLLVAASRRCSASWSCSAGPEI